jgi:hypothetical protein
MLRRARVRLERFVNGLNGSSGLEKTVPLKSAQSVDRLYLPHFIVTHEGICTQGEFFLSIESSYCLHHVFKLFLRVRVRQKFQSTGRIDENSILGNHLGDFLKESTKL